MVRRSFRVGLRLGLLAGVVVTLFKVVQSRRSTREEAVWPPLQPEPVAVEPLAATVTERMRPETERPPPFPPPAPAPPAVAPPMAPAPVPPLPAAAPLPAPPAAAPPAPAPVARVVKKAAKTRRASAPRAAPPAEPGPADRSATGAKPVRGRVRKARRQPWVEPLGNDAPTSHPVKAKLSSMLYHLPGMAFYNRTRPDRCYVDAEAAEADGFIRSKR